MVTPTANVASHTGRSPPFPRVVFGSSALGNLYEAPSDDRKLAITQAWLANGTPTVLVDSAGKYGAGLALECLGRNLRRLSVKPDDIVISNKLGWYRVPLRSSEPTFEPGAWVGLEHDAEQRIGRQGILDCWEQGCQLLGEPYRPQLVSVHDPDDYLAAAVDPADRVRRQHDLLEAYDSLVTLRQAGHVQAIGIGCKDWRVAREISEQVDLDWVMVANSLTLYTHPPELLDWIDSLAARGIAVINSAVFNAGFLIGGEYFNYHRVCVDDPAYRRLFDWRSAFLDVCNRHQVTPAAACIQFGLSPPGVVSVALNTSDPERVPQNVQAATVELPAEFWQDLKQHRLIDRDYPHVG